MKITMKIDFNHFIRFSNMSFYIALVNNTIFYIFSVRHCYNGQIATNANKDSALLEWTCCSCVRLACRKAIPRLTVEHSAPPNLGIVNPAPTLT